MNKKTNNIYGLYEFIIDLFIAIPTALFYLQIAKDIKIFTAIITIITFIFCVMMLHLDILSRWDKKMHKENKIKRKERLLYIQTQQQKKED